MIIKKILLAFFTLLLFASCSFEFSPWKELKHTTINYTTIDCPLEISERAYSFAKLYTETDTEYEWGGQDPLRSVIGIDCSGLVIMCYKYAMVDTVYSLVKTDMTAAYMYDYACSRKNADTAQKGDLLFMGDESSTDITHIGIFEKLENDTVYFIDSSQASNGVKYRSYPINNKKIKGYGRMRVKY